MITNSLDSLSIHLDEVKNMKSIIEIVILFIFSNVSLKKSTKSVSTLPFT